MIRGIFERHWLLLWLIMPLALTFGASVEVINCDFEDGLLPEGVGTQSTNPGAGTTQVIDDGSGENYVLSMTQGVNSQGNWIWFPDQFDLTNKRVEVEFNLFIGRGTSGTPADAVSVIFQFENDLEAIATTGGSNACGNLRNALTNEPYEYVAVEFDIWHNGADPADACWSGNRTAHAAINQNLATLATQPSQAWGQSPDYVSSATQYLASYDKDDLVKVSIVFDNRLMVVTMSGPVACGGGVFDEQQVLNYATEPFPERLSNIGFGASTGGANCNSWIDDLVVREGDSLVTMVREPPRTSGAMNLGGGGEVDATDEVGIHFDADRDYGAEMSREGDVVNGLTITTSSMGRVSGENTNTNTRLIDVSNIDGAGPAVAGLFESIRWSTSGIHYRAEIEPGRYDVTLYWCEGYLASINASGQSLKFFDVSLNGEKVLANWSPASAAGHPGHSGNPFLPCHARGDTAISRTFSVDCGDVLDIVIDDLGGGMPPEHAILNALNFERTGNATGDPASGDVELVMPPASEEPDGILIEADFEDGLVGECPEGAVCNSNGSYTPQVVPGTLDNVFRILQDGTNSIANSLVFEQTVDVYNHAFKAEFDVFMSWTGTPADGGAFFVREGANPNVVGGVGGAMGIPTNANGFCVEFDTWQGGGNNEPSGFNVGTSAYTHVGINNMSTDSIVTSVGFDPDLRPVAFGGTGWPSFADATGVHVEVLYDAGRVQVYLSGVTHNLEDFDRTLVAEAEVPPIMSSEAVVGFCGATGGANQTLDVDNIVITANPGVAGGSLNAALQSARDRWDSGSGELYINCGGGMLVCDAHQYPAPAATGDVDEGDEVIWVADDFGGGAAAFAGEFFSLTPLNSSDGLPNGLNVALTDMGTWDARGTSPGVDDNDKLFHTERFCDMQYDIPVPDGNYEVTLYFANSHSGTAGTARRFFQVAVEGTILDGFEHCEETAPGVANPLYDAADQHDDIFDPVGAADMLFSDDPCEFSSCLDNGVIALDDPDNDGIPASAECGNAAAAFIRINQAVSDGMLSIAIIDPDPDKPLSPDGNPKISGMAIKAAGGAGTFIYTGDVNGDRTINLADAVSLLTYLFVDKNDPGIACLKSADANDDGRLDLADAVSILTYQFTNGSMTAPDGELLSSGDTGCFPYSPAEVGALGCETPCQ